MTLTLGVCFSQSKSPYSITVDSLSKTIVDKVEKLENISFTDLVVFNYNGQENLSQTSRYYIDTLANKMLCCKTFFNIKDTINGDFIFIDGVCLKATFKRRLNLFRTIKVDYYIQNNEIAIKNQTGSKVKIEIPINNLMSEILIHTENLAYTINSRQQ